MKSIKVKVMLGMVILCHFIKEKNVLNIKIVCQGMSVLWNCILKWAILIGIFINGMYKQWPL